MFSANAHTKNKGKTPDRKLKTSQQNGVAERLNRTLDESATTMLIQGKLTQKFWVEALNTSACLHNRSLTRPVDNAISLEAWTRVKPDVKHLLSFGCIAIRTHSLEDERKKFDSKIRKCVFLGYGTETKRYRLYDCEKQ